MKKGFTLIELLVVVLIIGILAAAALPQYSKAVTRAKNRTAILNMRHIAQAIEMYDLSNGALPDERSSDFSILNIEDPSSRDWKYFFYCFDDIKSCFITADPNREVKVGTKDYLLKQSVINGKPEPFVTVGYSMTTSETENEDGSTTNSYESGNKADEEVCRLAAGTMTADGCIIN